MAKLGLWEVLNLLNFGVNSVSDLFRGANGKIGMVGRQLGWGGGGSPLNKLVHNVSLN